MKHKHTQGFTLIELLLYCALLTIISSSLIPFAWRTISHGTRASTAEEVAGNARFVSERIKYEIRNAKNILAVTPTSITLEHHTPALNPTVIDVSGNFLRIKQGTGPAVNLHAADTAVSGVTFINASSADSKTKHIQYSFVLSASGSTRVEYQSQIAIEGSAEVRSH